MTKTLIVIGIVLGALLIAGVILSLVAPKRISVSNTTFINASKQHVFDQLRYMKNFPKWSPFLAADPAQKYEVKGTDGTVGAQYHWDGNGGKDLGFQEIKKIGKKMSG